MTSPPYRRRRQGAGESRPKVAKARGAVRRGQLVTTFGPGAILPIEDESFMVCGIDRWTVSEPNLHEPRLERELHVRGFVIPPAEGAGRDVPVVRFPRWHSCPGCRRLAPHDYFTDFHGNQCPECNRDLIPSRFVVACLRGHVDDFPYSRWVHEGGAAGDGHELSLETRGTTASLADMVVKCSCGARRTMESAFDRFALRDITRCFGSRPWLTRKDDSCSESVRALQRGASNVWFSHTRSALSIPPWSQGAHRILERYWGVLKAVPDHALVSTIEGLRLARLGSYTAEDLAAAVRERMRRNSGDAATEPLRTQEYSALCRGKPEESHDAEFVAIEAEVGEELRPFVAQVMLVKRLREVRALEGFSRVLPVGGHDDDRLAGLFETDPGWLPAIEVKGEGVFLRFDGAALNTWSDLPAVKKRVGILDKRQRGRAERHGWAVQDLSAAKVLIHTLSHLLIDQFALEAGYPTAALRERLYVQGDQAGLLIYTATTDSAGSLGGVVAQAAPARLAAAVAEALSRAGWCSADPVCMESDGQGVDSLNLAACHACALLPETSCEEFNMLLDRALLVGEPGYPELGFFAALVST